MEPIMTTITDPVIGRWYKDLENDLKFIVVAIDNDSDDIEVQYIDGDISEYDYDSWYNSTFDFIEAPEDWSAPFGEIATDDLGYSDPDVHKPKNEEKDLADWLD